MEELFQLVVKTYGLAGILMLAPVVALKLMWNHAKDLQSKLEAAQERVNAVHAQRVTDAQQVAEKLMRVMQEHSELSRETNIALDRVGDMLSVLQSSAVAQRTLVSPRRLRGDSGTAEE